MYQQTCASKFQNRSISNARQSQRTMRKTLKTDFSITKVPLKQMKDNANASLEAPERKGAQLTVESHIEPRGTQLEFKLNENKTRFFSRDSSFLVNLDGSNSKNIHKLVEKQTPSKAFLPRSICKTRHPSENGIRKTADIDIFTTKSSNQSVQRYHTSKIHRLKKNHLKNTKSEQSQRVPKKMHAEENPTKQVNFKDGFKMTSEQRGRVKDTQVSKIGQRETSTKTTDRKKVHKKKVSIKEKHFIKEIELCTDHSKGTKEGLKESNLKKVKINLKRCMYKVIENVASSLGMEITRDDENESWDVYWSDYSITTVKSKSMTLCQRINHFPGMANLESKAFLAYHLNRMKLEFPLDYNFFPVSWSLPYQNQECMTYVENHPKEVYILKPSRGAEGKGIKVFSNVEDMKTNHTEAVCQMYISKLLLLDNFKFDLRVYVLIACIDPLQVFVYNNGLVRLATCQYAAPNASNMNNQFMHLTNYSINKGSNDYDPSEEGSKRDFETFNKWLLSKDLNGEKLWRDIDDIIIKAFIAIHPILKDKFEELFPTHYKQNISACFELLGFDIIIDRAMKPYLLEVNRSPSFNITGEVDEKVKKNLIEDTFRLLNLQSVFPKRDQLNPIGSYRQIYPTAKSYEYSKFVHFIFTIPSTNEDKKRIKQMS